MISETFLRAGKAIFTVDNGNGKHYTYRVSKAKEAGRDGQFAYFVGVLTGSDNEASYTYMGLLTPQLTLRTTAKSSNLATSQPGAVFVWAMRVISGEKSLPDGYDIKHAGRCGRCGRTLTVPESIETGLGPECAGRVAA